MCAMKRNHKSQLAASFSGERWGRRGGPLFCFIALFRFIAPRHSPVMLATATDKFNFGQREESRSRASSIFIRYGHKRNTQKLCMHSIICRPMRKDGMQRIVLRESVK